MVSEENAPKNPTASPIKLEGGLAGAAEKLFEFKLLDNPTI